MKNSRLFFLLLVAGMLCVSTQALANVFASNVRVTQQGTAGTFDGRWTDGTGVSLRFTLSDHADSVVAVIKQGATVVRTIKATDLPNVDTSIVWDGKNNAGTYVTTGSYTLSLTTYDKGYSTYTALLSDVSAAGLSQRGGTTINNPALKSFGSIFYVDNGGFQGVTGPARLAANLDPWGDAKGVAKMSYTGATLGSNDAKWGVQSDEDGYVYVLARNTAPKGIYRFHPDTMKVVMVDSAYGAYYPFGIAVRKDVVGKTFAVVTDNTSSSTTLSGDSRVLTYHVNDDAPYFGTKDTLLKGNGTIMYWDVIFGRDSALYATFMYPGDLIHSGVAKFDLRGKTLPLTISDTAWTARLDTGRASTLSMFWGSATDGSKDVIYVENVKTASGMVGQGIWAFTGLNTRPTRVSVFVGGASSSTRTDVSVDAVGNVVYIENSNETMSLISPPTGSNNYTTTAAMSVQVINSIPIASAIIDANKDFIPDSLGKTVTVIGVVNNVNFQGAANFQYCIQDDNSGIMVFKSGAGGPVLNIGYRVLVTGVIAQYRGTNEITPAAFTNVQILDSNNVLTPVSLTIAQFKANGEPYESRLIKFSGLGKLPGTVAWPAAGADASPFMLWDGYDSLYVRLDKDTPIPGSTEPAFPVNLQGVVTQYTSAATVYNDGYQLSPSQMTDFTAGVQVPPNPHFALVAPAKGTTIKLDSTTQSIVFTWKRAIDLNGDALIYQWAPVGSSAVITTNAGADTFLVRTGAQLRTLMSGNDTITLKWTVKTKDAANPIVSNADTSLVILVKGAIVGVPLAEQLPTSYALAQNFPNPFNPSTMIKFSLPNFAKVVLKVYDIIGREVAELVNQELAAGYHQYQFNANNLAGGVYLYRITAAGSVDGKESRFSDVKKLMLLK
jgi:flagellar hook assembly protein FlgD